MSTSVIPVALDETFDAVVFDWDGTAVPDRLAVTDRLKAAVEAACAAGLHLFVVSGTHVGNVDKQLSARPAGPGSLHLCLNRGSEVFRVDGGEPVLVARRSASGDEDDSLDRAASLAVDAFRARGLDVEIVSHRLNRRKIDLIPVVDWADPPKACFAALLEAVSARLRTSTVASLRDAVGIAQDAAYAAGLPDARVTTDAKHVEIGLTDKADSARWAASWLADQGITGALILIAGDEFGALDGVPGSDALMLIPEFRRSAVVSVGIEPLGLGAVADRVMHLGGGPDQFVAVVEEQVARRRVGRVPRIDVDPSWTITLPTHPLLERAAEALGTVANGWAGIRGAREEDGSGTTPRFSVSGVYTNGTSADLLPGPLWTGLAYDPVGTDDEVRMLDLRTGVLYRQSGTVDPVRTMRFVAAGRPEALALRAEGPAPELGSGPPLQPPSGTTPFRLRSEGDTTLARTGADESGGIVVATRDRGGLVGPRRTIERLAAWVTDTPEALGWDAAATKLDRLEEVGFDRLLADHRATWARLWADADIKIDGSPDDDLAARLAVFHLLANVPPSGEAAVGARGLTGPAYGGHVFWDADVFVLPALAAFRPSAARAMLEYRLRRIPAARALAAERGCDGARFPWESAGDGSDATPQFVTDPRGQRVEIHTGQHEDHVVADVAWAAWLYQAWTGDTTLLRGPGRALLLDTARYWASRVEFDESGIAHLQRVIGPDEYHVIVDDNAFTNVMARWNLRRGADLADSLGVDPAAAMQWRHTADALYDGYDRRSGVYEQFAGYFALEPLLAAHIGEPPFAADMVLPPERVAGSQLLKQADVLMLHHLVPDDVEPGSLVTNLAYYDPRTVHGSSLSPAIHAALHARAGNVDRALELFRLAARLDLDDRTGTTASGLHLATFGGVWQAIAYGFLGLRPYGDVLAVDPRLPPAWDRLTVRFRFLGHPVVVEATKDQVTIRSQSPVVVRVANQPARRCDPPLTTVDLEVPT